MMDEKGYGTLILKKDTKGVPRLRNVFCKPHFLSLKEDATSLRIAGLSLTVYAEKFKNLDRLTDDEVRIIKQVHPEIEDMNLSPLTQPDSDEERYRLAYRMWLTVNLRQ